MPTQVRFATQPFGKPNDQVKPGDAAHITLMVSEPPTSDLKITLNCTGFAESPIQITVNKGKSAPIVVPVTVVKKPGMYVAELSSPKAENIGMPARFVFNLKGSAAQGTIEPAISFADQPIRTIGGEFDPGQTVAFNLTMYPAPRDKPATVAIKCDAFLPNVVTAVREVGSEPDFYIEARLNPNPPRPSVQTAASQQLATHTVEIQALENCTRGARKTVEIKLRPPVEIGFEIPQPDAERGVYPGERMAIKVRLARPAPPGGCMATLKCDAFRHAGANPDGSFKIFVEEGATTARGVVTFYSAPGGKMDVERITNVLLATPVDACVIGPASNLPVKVHPLPRVKFADGDAWIEPKKDYHFAGERVTMKFELDKPATRSGAVFHVVCPAFGSNGPYKGVILEGERQLTADVQLLAGNPTPGTKLDVRIELPEQIRGCLLSDDAAAIQRKIEVRPAPNVRFKAGNAWISPFKPEYEEGEKVQIFVELDAAAPDDAAAKLESSAFNGMSYFAHFPSGMQDQGAFKDDSEKDIPGRALDSGQQLVDKHPHLVASVTGLPVGLIKTPKTPPPPKSVTVTLKRGYLIRNPIPAANADNGDAGVSSSDASNAQQGRARSGAVSNASGASAPPDPSASARPRRDAMRLSSNEQAFTVEIGEQAIRLLPVTCCQLPMPADNERKIKVRPAPNKDVADPSQPCPFTRPPPPPGTPCNQHRLLIVESHGNGPALRGHDGKGTFETVISDQAPKLHPNAFTSPGHIEMIAGKVINTIDEAMHKTTVDVKADVADYWCNDLFPHPDGEDVRHPKLIVLRKQIQPLELALASPAKAKLEMRAMEQHAARVPQYPGWVTYYAKPAVAGPLKEKGNIAGDLDTIRPKAEAGAALWSFKVMKRKQKYEKYLAKAFPAPLKLIDTGIGTFRIGDIIRAVQTIFAPRLEHFKVILETCGLPDPKRKLARIPAHRLIANIDVYPSEEFCLFANVSPFEAVKMGNEGKYFDINGKLKPQEDAARGGQLKDELGRPIQDARTNIGGIDAGPATSAVQGSLNSALSGVTATGASSPLANQPANETGRNPTQQTSFERRDAGSHGKIDSTGAIQQEAPQPGSGYAPASGKSLIYSSDMHFLTSGKSSYQVLTKDPNASPQLAIAPKPTTRVFHAVTGGQATWDAPRSVSEDATHTGEWTTARCGLFVNGGNKPEFMPVGQAVYALAYMVRHFGDFFQALQEMVPSWGWGVTVDIGFLEGQFAMRWGWKEYEDHRVFRWWQLEANLNLFRVGVELWVGFKARALFIKFEFVLYGKISGMLPAKASIERAGPDGGVSWDASFGASTTAEIGVRVILVHENALYAGACVKTGYLFKFKFKDPTEDKLGIFWEGYFLGLSARFTIKVVGYKKVIQKEKVFIEGNPPDLPGKQGCLLPRGSNGSQTAWRVRRNMRHVWQRCAAHFGRLDEALNEWHQLQHQLVCLRAREEFERDAERDEKADWPWTDDPEVSVSPFGSGVRIRTEESYLWRKQWDVCRRSVKNGFVDAAGDGKDGVATGKVQRKSRWNKIPKIGKKIAGKTDLANELSAAIEANESAIERIKIALVNVDQKYMSRLRWVDREVFQAEEEERPVKQEAVDLVSEAESWARDVVGPLKGEIVRLVEDALEGIKLSDFAYYIDKLKCWRSGAKLLRPDDPAKSGPARPTSAQAPSPASQPRTGVNTASTTGVIQGSSSVSGAQPAPAAASAQAKTP